MSKSDIIAKYMKSVNSSQPQPGIISHYNNYIRASNQHHPT
jgi:hypothetical protein